MATSRTDGVTAQSGPQHWTGLIDEIVADKWYNPELRRVMKVDYESIVFKESLDGAEADLVRPLGLGTNFAVVADEATYAALGARVERALRALGPVTPIVLDHPHADLETVEDLRNKLRPYEAVVAVGSGTINDLCKYATHLDGRGYCVFATAASITVFK